MFKQWRRFWIKCTSPPPYVSLADAARDRGDWYEAAQLYALHLALAPGDIAIWVQRGHMLKEDGRLSDSLAAYSKAETLAPDDADLMLSIGHLHKVAGAPADALSYYVRSAMIDGNRLATAEVGRLLRTQMLDGPALAMIEHNAAAIFAQLGTRMDGLRLAFALGLEAQGDTMVPTIAEPWIDFFIDPPLNTVLVELTIEGSSIGRLLIDYGDGFDDRHAFVPSGVGVTRTLLAYPALIHRLRLMPMGATTLRCIAIRPVNATTAYVSSARAAGEQRAARTALHRIATIAEPTRAEIVLLQDDIAPLADDGFHYSAWLETHVTPQPADYERMAEQARLLPFQPRFSFVLPVYDPPPALLKECIDSLLAQTWPGFEVCIADDASPNPAIRDMLTELAARDPRVKVTVRAVNGHIAAASNSALALATGDFVVLIDHDDVIPDYALFVIADAINRHPAAQILFSDEDKITINGLRHAPYFKTNFNRFLMYGHNMVSHLGVYNRQLVEDVGGFRSGFDGSQDYDLFLRCYDRVGDNAVVHVPHVLYHWRVIPGSTAYSHDQKSYALGAAKVAIDDHFARIGAPLVSIDGFAPGLTGIAATQVASTRVSVVIATRDGLTLLQDCLASIRRTDAIELEIVIVDNGSRSAEMIAYLHALDREPDVVVVRYDTPFNFSALMNVGAAAARGDIVCFLNDDTEIVSNAWLDRARTLLALTDVGVVGARLVYPNHRLQHFGIVLGMADHRVAGSPHLGFHKDDPGYFGKAKLVQEFSAVTAACMFVRKAEFEALGGFDPTLAVAYNDVDLCLRYRRAGLRVVADPEIEVVHKESVTRGSDTDPVKRARLDDEAALMRMRWGPELDADPYLSPNHDLDRPDFALSREPRVAPPWRRSGDGGATPGHRYP